MAQLRHQLTKLHEVNTQVVVISFIEDDRVNDWLEQTQTPFPILLDPQRDVYRLYGLESSFWRSFNLRTLWFYVRQMLQGKALHGIQGNPNQLGGDFVIDTNGIIQFAYYSDDPTDRPSLNELFEHMKEADKSVTVAYNR